MEESCTPKELHNKHAIYFVHGKIIRSVTVIICFAIFIGSLYYFNDVQHKINQSLSVCIGGIGGNTNLNVQSYKDIIITDSDIDVLGGNSGCTNYFNSEAPKLQIYQIISLLGIVLSSVVSIIAIYDWLTKRNQTTKTSSTT